MTDAGRRLYWDDGLGPDGRRLSWDELGPDGLAALRRIVAVRRGMPGEMFTPDTPWLRQDTTPRPVPDLDADGNPWQITAEGLHVGTHEGDGYCLEWLPVPHRPLGGFGRTEGRDTAGRQGRPQSARAETEPEAGA